jgi:hypothetical protein
VLIYLPKGNDGADKMLFKDSVNLEYCMRYNEFRK